MLEAPREAGDKTVPPASRERWLAAARSTAPSGGETSPVRPPGGAAQDPEGLVQVRAAPGDALVKEIDKGYDIAFVGVNQPLSTAGPRFEEPLHGLVDAFDGPVAILMNAAGRAFSPGVALNILVPTDGRPDTRLATEIALDGAGLDGGEEPGRQVERARLAHRTQAVIRRSRC